MTAQMTVSAPATHNTAATSLVKAAGVEFTYRRFGRSAQLPLVITALGLDESDLLGFSIGGFVAQEIALVRPGVMTAAQDQQATLEES